MVAYHTPKVYRSTFGCCICKAKSSSSRFTESSRYEDQFVGCFKLEEMRYGEICNACVLLIKRWKKLPPGTKKNWKHVVDARARPQGKSRTRGDRRQISEPHDKHVYRKFRRHRYIKRTDYENADQEDSDDHSTLDNFSEASGSSAAPSRVNSPSSIYSPSPSFHDLVLHPSSRFRRLGNTEAYSTELREPSSHLERLGQEELYVAKRSLSRRYSKLEGSSKRKHNKPKKRNGRDVAIGVCDARYLISENVKLSCPSWIFGKEAYPVKKIQPVILESCEKHLINDKNDFENAWKEQNGSESIPKSENAPSLFKNIKDMSNAFSNSEELPVMFQNLKDTSNLFPNSKDVFQDHKDMPNRFQYTRNEFQNSENLFRNSKDIPNSFQHSDSVSQNSKDAPNSFQNSKDVPNPFQNLRKNFSSEQSRAARESFEKNNLNFLNKKQQQMIRKSESYDKYDQTLSSAECLLDLSKSSSFIYNPISTSSVLTRMDTFTQNYRTDISTNISTDNGNQNYSTAISTNKSTDNGNRNYSTDIFTNKSTVNSNQNYSTDIFTNKSPALVPNHNILYNQRHEISREKSANFYSNNSESKISSALLEIATALVT